METVMIADKEEEDSERIDRILNLIDCIWRRYPHIKLTQLIMGVLPYQVASNISQLLNCKDEDLEKHLKEALSEEIWSR
jgi:hypothetical protein